MSIKGRVTSNLRAANAPPLNRSLEIQWWITKAWPHFPLMALSGVPGVPAQLCHSDEQSAATFLHRIMWPKILSKFLIHLSNKNYIEYRLSLISIFKFCVLNRKPFKFVDKNKKLLNNELLLLIQVDNINSIRDRLLVKKNKKINSLHPTKRKVSMDKRGR